MNAAFCSWRQTTSAWPFVQQVVEHGVNLGARDAEDVLDALVDQPSYEQRRARQSVALQRHPTPLAPRTEDRLGVRAANHERSDRHGATLLTTITGGSGRNDGVAIERHRRLR